MVRLPSWNLFSRFSNLTSDVDFQFPSLFGADPAVRWPDAAGAKGDDARRLADGGAIEAGGAPAAATSASLFPTTADTVADDIGTSATLTVGAPAVIGTLDTIGDQDFFRVELVAGQSYEIGQYAHVGGPSGLPNANSYVEIYDVAGQLIVSADGGADTPYNQINSGFDVLMTFTPEVSGIYYVNARGFDQDATNGTTGDSVGDYELFVRPASPSAYKPYYDVDSPLYAIDWGTQVDNTSRNPDGAEGPRPTGNPATGYAWNPYGIEGKNVITYYFARQGEIFIDENPATPGTTETMIAKGFADWEKGVYLNAFGEYAKVADLVYVEVQNRAEADFVLITYDGTPGPGVSLLGRMSPPDEENEGRTEFNANDERWTEDGLQPGGFSFTTLIHELGHGHGLAHPHDNGGRSGVMRGVEADGPAFDYTNGDFDLNQSVFTMMSYEDGWQKSPYGQAATQDPYGWLGSLMAFDIAAIQDKYGVNEEWATGDDVYRLEDENAPGTFYACIWDAGGSDSIRYDGARDAVIDLRAASLEYEDGGGGWISYAWGVFGGFTIANGVTIENASSGAGNDVLTGNDAVNKLAAGAGDDVLNGGGGGDQLWGGAGRDRIDGGLGDDIFWVDGGDTLIEAAGAGQDAAYASESFALAAGAEVERLATANYLDIAALDLAGNEIANWITGSNGVNTLSGGGGDDKIEGLHGDDRLIGGAGSDRMWGGAGEDIFSFLAASDSRAGAADRILDFASGADTIDLAGIDADSGTAGNQAFTFIGTSAFSNKAGELRCEPVNGQLSILGDTDGDGAADFQLIVSGTTIVATDFIL